MTSGKQLHTGSAAAHANAIADSFRLVAETRRQLTQVNQQAGDVVKRFYRDPDQLAAFIERHGTPVYTVPGHAWAYALLKAAGLEAGYNPPVSARRRRLAEAVLKLMQPHAQCTLANGLFVVPANIHTISFLTHQLHHWLSYRAGMGGYESDAQKLYRLFWEKHQGHVTHELLAMPRSELMKLKAAISRDLEALTFLQGIIQEVLDPDLAARLVMAQSVTNPSGAGIAEAPKKT
ncbi:MAG: hypothetical protein AB7P76_09640 [Candidatus Melainabacteria bacterium]